MDVGSSSLTVGRRWVTRAFWGGFFSLVLLAWGVLFYQSQGTPSAGLGAFHPGFAAGLHNGFSPVQILGMWMLMVLAMMLPTLVPMVRTLNDLVAREPQPWIFPAAFVLGYVLVWVGFSLIAGAGQMALAALGLLDAGGILLYPGATVFLLLLAGLYQFSALKQACLRFCQAPLLFFVAHWRAGGVGAAGMGLRHGLICVGCCWALMALGFVGGVMNLLWMGLATALMILEKLPAIGVPVRPLIGSVLLALAVAYATVFLADWVHLGRSLYGLAS